MKKKKLKSTSKDENVAPKKGNGKKSFPLKAGKDFGGIPNMDAKIFLSCG
jgi:hypothetical protein